MTSLQSAPRLRQTNVTTVLAILVLALSTAFFPSSYTYGQTPSGQQSDTTTDTPTTEKPKQQKTVTRSAAMTATGDSAAGSIGGIKSPENIKVSAGGAATQSIPIVVPPGTAGVQPNLTFSYNSQGENSLLGVGWSVSGLPVIHRCPRTVAQDGVRGGVNYDTNDRFCLDGQRLMAISGAYGANLTEYRTEVDSFLKVISYGTAGNGPAYFVVKNKAGETMEFGGNATSQEGRIEAQGKTSVRVWAVSKISDVKGNYLTVTYAEDATNGEYRPTQIDYTGNASGSLTPNRKVTFEYTTRTDLIPQWVGGSKILTTKLLSNIKTYVGASIVRDYRMEYESGTATGRSRLKRIRECDGAGNCLPANTPGSQPAWQLTWQEGGDGSFQTLSYNVPINTFRNAAAWSGDFNGDGKTDLLSADGGNINTHFSNGDGTYAAPVSFPHSTAFSETYNWVGDFNGDGLDDFVMAANGKLYMYISQGNGNYVLQPSFTYNTNKININAIWVGDIDGDGRADLISNKGNHIYTYRSLGNGSYDPPGDYTIANNNWFEATNTHLGDFNGDGLIDIFSRDNGNGNVYINIGNGQFQSVSISDSSFRQYVLRR